MIRITHYLIARVGRSVLRISTAFALLVGLLAWCLFPSDVQAASITVPSAKLASCDLGTTDAFPSAAFSDGQVGFEWRCYLNKGHANYGSLAASIIAGTAPNTFNAYVVPTAGGTITAKTCTSFTGTNYEHGYLVNNAGTTLATDSGYGFPENYFSLSLVCNSTTSATSYYRAAPDALTIGGVNLGTGTNTTGMVINPAHDWGSRCGDPATTTYDNFLCARDLTDSGELALHADYTTNPDWFGTYVGPVQGPCQDHVAFDYYLNGESIDLVESINVNVAPDDDLRIVLTIGGGAWGTDLTQSSFAWRGGHGPEFAWLTNLQLATTPIVVGDTAVVGFLLNEGGGFPLNYAELRCTDVEGTWYLDAGNNWDDEQAPYRPCTAITATIPQQGYEMGDTVTVLYRIGPGPYDPNDAGVDLQFWVSIDGTVTTEDDITSWNRYGGQVGGTTPFLYELPMTPDSQGELRFVMPVDGDPSYGNIRCTDSDGQTRLYGTSRVVNGTFHGTVNEEAACYQGAGMTLQPSTWLRGFARMGTCLAGELVVPDGDVVSDVATDVMDEVSDVPPFSFFVTAAVFVDTANDSFQSPSGSGCFNFGGLIPGTSQDVTCYGDAVETSSGQRAIIALLLCGGIYLGLLSHAVSLVREK